MRGRSASAGFLGALLAELDELEGAGAGDRLHVGPEVDDGALTGEDVLRTDRCDDRPGDTGSAADRDGGGLRVDRRFDIDGGTERRAVGLRVIGGIDRIDLDQTDAREKSEEHTSELQSLIRYSYAA